MTARILEAVPNFSEGRDASVVRDIVEAMRDAGAAILDWSADADHHRSVVTIAGTPAVVEDAAVVAARVALERIDLRRHRGVHPRMGAVDVLPFVPLHGLTLADAKESAHRVGVRIARDVGIPVFYYGHASDPPGRTLGEIRRGGYEALVDGWTHQPDALPSGWPHAGAHPTAGAVAVGARNVLLAWNVFVRGLPMSELRRIAAGLRETNGGVRGLRALAFELPSRNECQISMNLENAEEAEPMTVFARIEAAVAEAGGDVVRTEVIGLAPDRLLHDAAAERLRLEPGAAERSLSRALIAHLAD